MSNPAECTRPAAAPNPTDSIASPTGIIVKHGHEPVIAQPSTFLLPRGQNRAMTEKPLTALDKDQQQGLVSGAPPSDVGVWDFALDFAPLLVLGLVGTDRTWRG